MIDTRTTAIIDQVAILAWLASTNFVSPATGLILYSICGYIVLQILLNMNQFTPALVRNWPMFLIGFLCILSSLWAPSAPEAIRKGLLFFVTGMIGIYFAMRLTARQILYSMFLVLSAAAIASAISPNYENGIAVGIYDAKNVLAINMYMLLGPALLLLFDGKGPAALRIAAISMAPIAIYLMLAAQSSTAIALSASLALALLVHEFVWRPSARIANARTLIALAFFIMLVIAAFVVFAIAQIDVLREILEMLGKDSTFTGRTILWEHAQKILDTHPWTGLGANGFWRPEVGAANSLIRLFYYDSYVAFSFHNSYLELGSQLGYPGFVAAIFVAGWTLLQALRSWLANQTIFNIYFLALTILTIIRSLTEVDFAVEFGTIWVFIAAARFGVPQRESPTSTPPPPGSPPPLFRRNYPPQEGVRRNRW